MVADVSCRSAVAGRQAGAYESGRDSSFRMPVEPLPRRGSLPMRLPAV